MGRPGFWLRWSLRDLRRRRLQVLATALVIAIGVAVFAGLGGLREFREESAQRSFAALRFHDLRVTLPEGSTARRGELERLIRRAGPDVPVAAVQERLLVPTQLDGRPAGEDVLTPGLVVGVPVGDAGDVDRVRAIRGRTLRPADAGRAVAVLDRSYASFYDLPDRGSLRLPGGERIDYVGQGQSPQYFLITSETGFGGESTLGVLYAPLDTAQRLAGRPGQVDEVVVRLVAGSDPVAAQAAVRRAVASRLPGAEVVRGDEEQAWTILFRDARNDQRMMTVFGLLVLLGASIAAFNLVARTVEAERREIGIGMALGLPTGRLALRPLLLGAEIALAGTVLGALLSVWVSGAFASIYEEFLPLPVYTDPFRPSQFARGALVGFLLPFAATVWPVWRGVRVQPVEAIRVSARAASGGMVRAATRIRLPGGTVAQMPWRNASRTPRRTLLAVVGLGAVLGSTIALVGIVDSFDRTIEQSREELVGDAPGRLHAELRTLDAETAPAVRALARAPGVRAIDPRLDLPASLGAGGADVPVVLTVNADEGAVWRPRIDEGRAPRGAGEIAIAPKAADDLGVDVGETLTLEVTGRAAEGGPVLRRLRLRVSGLTKDPFRVFAFADAPLAAALGLSGTTNALSVLPEPGATAGAVQRTLAASGLVATTRPVTADSDALADTVDQFTGIIQVAAAAALVLAMLMAFNLAAISLEERRREYATMFAYGVPVRRALRIAATENLVVGVLGTALGALVGLVAISWMISALFTDTWPEIGMIRHLSPGSMVLAVLVGVVAVTVTPYVLARRLTRMDVPSTLRVVE